MAVNNGLSMTANDLVLGWTDVTSVGTNQSLNGFLGFTSADRFSGVRVGAICGAASSYRMDTFAVAAVPEPSSWALMAGGLALVWFCLRRRKTQD